MRYYFDLENGDAIIRDEQGVVADDLDQATEQAILAVQEMRAAGELPAEAGAWSLIIRLGESSEMKRFRL